MDRPLSRQPACGRCGCEEHIVFDCESCPCSAHAPIGVYPKES